MRAVLYKTNKPKSIYQDFGLFVLYNRTYGMLNKEQEIKTYSKPLGRPPKQQPPPILVEMAKAVSERNEVECSFSSGKRIYRANNIRAKRPETARCWTGMCYFVKNVMKFLRELHHVFDKVCGSYVQYGGLPTPTNSIQIALETFFSEH